MLVQLIAAVAVGVPLEQVRQERPEGLLDVVVAAHERHDRPTAADPGDDSCQDVGEFGADRQYPFPGR